MANESSTAAVPSLTLSPADNSTTKSVGPASFVSAASSLRNNLTSSQPLSAGVPAQQSSVSAEPTPILSRTVEPNVPSSLSNETVVPSQAAVPTPRSNQTEAPSSSTLAPTNVPASVAAATKNNSTIPSELSGICNSDLFQQCQSCYEVVETPSNLGNGGYSCDLPGLASFTPGAYEGVEANFLSFATEIAAPHFPVRAKELEACTGGRIVFSEAQNIWEDPVYDLGTKRSRGTELYDGYFMSYAHFPEVAALDLAEPLNDRIRRDNEKLVWEDFLPKVREMGAYRKDGVNEINFLMFDGDFFVPIVRLDLLQEHNFSIPNTWDEVVEIASYFNGTDLNEDGDSNDFGICHFPRLGAGYWDWWWAEAIYSTWASFDQTEGINQGFFFNETTLEPRIGNGFRRSAEVWKGLWNHGSNCEDSKFRDGRCAIGFGPPGCWKAVFQQGVSRKDQNGTVIWRPTMKSGEYAEPYRFKPFGSTHVVHRKTGEFVKCTYELCPKAEVIPRWGHHGDEHRTNVLKPSELQGQLINRSPFYWSGGLGTLIRKSAQEDKKDLLWDFFVYANSPDTSVYDVAHYKSWLDSWRYSQLLPGDNFLSAEWSEHAYTEHQSIMQWALSQSANSAYNLRIPGLSKYTRDVVGNSTMGFITDSLTMDSLLEQVHKGWEEVHAQEGKLGQLEIYRASLNLDGLEDFLLCRHHRELMDERDPSICSKYDKDLSWIGLSMGLAAGLAIIVAVLFAFRAEQKRRSADGVWKIKVSELEFANPTEVLGRGTFGLVVVATYRGTRVAVKRVIPPKKVNSQSYASSSGISLGLADSSEDYFQASMRSEQPMDSGILHEAPSPSTRAASNKSGYTKLRSEFIIEMRYLAKLRHPSITTVMGAVIEMNEEPMLVMECMENGSLHDILSNNTMPIDGDLLLPILGDVTQGMRFLHSATPKVVHGDLKAANILVDSRFRAKVADFGLSAKKKVGATGTPFWMAPELLLGMATNSPLTDVYSFGIVISEVFARKDPYTEFDGEPMEAVIARITSPSIKLRPTVPKESAPNAVILMNDCVAGDPLERPTFEEIDRRVRHLDKESLNFGGTLLSFQQKKAARNQELLNRVFPQHVAEALRDGCQVEPDRADLATIFFSDIVGFTRLSSIMSADQVSDMLDRLYLKFDALTVKHDIFKLETIVSPHETNWLLSNNCRFVQGDAYMCVSSLLKPQVEDHVKRIAQFSIDAMNAAKETPILPDGSLGFIQMRVGFHSGPLVARVVGARNPKYCVFGDTVNTSSRMESTAPVGRIQCSKYSAMLLAAQCPSIDQEPRGLISIKGKGEMETVLLHYDETDKY